MHDRPRTGNTAPVSTLGITLALLLGGLAGPAGAQSLSLRDLLPDFVAQGITLARPAVGTNHEAHFFGDIVESGGALQQLNSELSNQLSTFPLTSSAGGFAYSFDPQLGVFNRQTTSFGPIYSERALTIGKGKFNFGMNYSTFTFNRLDGLRLDNGELKLVFRHQDTNNDGSNLQPFVEGDLITADLYMDLRSQVTAFVATYGVDDRLDIGMAVPIVSVDIDLSASASVLRLATADTLQETHRFPNGTDHQTYARNGHAAGLGDVAFRGKYRALRGERSTLAFSGELRLPTGESRNLLGTGAVQFTGGVVASLTRNGVSPHATLAYELADRNIPDQFTYTAGLDWAVDPRMTVACDLIGRYERDVPEFQVTDTTYQANQNADPTGPVRLVSRDVPGLSSTAGQNRNRLDGALGMKINVVRNLLLTMNGLFSLTRTGLSDGFTPLVGLDYSF